MPDRWQEDEIARLVSLYSETYRGIYLGDPELNDDGSSSSMFDFRFDRARPKVALEVTSIVDPHFIAASRVASRVADGLTEVVTKEGLGRWYVEVVAGARLNPIRQAILDSIQIGAPLPAGVKSVKQADGGEPGVVIYTWLSDPDRGIQPLTGFTQELDEAVSSNRKKLAMAKGYERHLAVDLLAWRAQDPALTPPPSLPNDIDVLWVFNRYTTAHRTDPIAWWIARHNEWSLSHPSPPVHPWMVRDQGTSDSPLSIMRFSEYAEEDFNRSLQEAINIGLPLDVVAKCSGLSHAEVTRRTTAASE